MNISINPYLRDLEAIKDVFKQDPNRLMPLIELLDTKYQELINTEATELNERDTNFMIDLEAILLGLGCYPEMDRE